MQSDTKRNMKIRKEMANTIQFIKCTGMYLYVQ